MPEAQELLVQRITDRVLSELEAEFPAAAPLALADDEPSTAHPVARLIDHTLLKATASECEFRVLCEEARSFGFASVCVPPSWVGLCADLLRDARPKVCTVVGFPLGNTSTAAKAFETAQAIADGAGEIDMVLPIGRLMSGDYREVADDIRAVVDAAEGRLVKVIIETVYLNEEQKIVGSVLSKACGAQFVKTSTGMAGAGATVEDVALMRRVVGPAFGVKAAGGVRTLADAEAMIKAGANRLGTSGGVAIVQGEKTSGGY